MRHTPTHTLTRLASHIPVRVLLALAIIICASPAVSARAPVERFGNTGTTAWTDSITYVPSWLDPGPARPGPFAAGVTPVPPRSPAGSLPFTLDFQPNGDGIEVDAPTAIAYSPDGQYILVPAKGTQPNAANLSVYSATDLAPVRVIPLTHAPESFALMANLPKAVLVNPDDDSVTIVDYEAGVELAVIPVGDLPRAVAVSPDDAVAVIQGGNTPVGGDVPWSIIDLATNTETARFTGTHPYATANPTYYFGSYHAPAQLVFLPSGDKVAVHWTGFPKPTVGLSVLDLATQEWTEVPAVSESIAQTSMAATPDGSVIAISYQDPQYDIRVAVVNTTTWVVQDFLINSSIIDVFASPLLLSSDGSRIAVNDGIGAYGGGVPTLWMLDTTTGVATPADTSGFAFSPYWLPVAESGDGANFLLWYQGYGDYSYQGDAGYQVFDWSGNSVAELGGTGLGHSDVLIDDSFTQLLDISPTESFQVAFVDPMKIGEDLVLLDLNPSDPQVLVHSQVGDGGIEGDAAVKVSLSADQSTALVLNAQSSTAFFLDMQTMARDWVAVPRYVSDAALLPDGDTAVFIAGAWLYAPPVANAIRLTLVDRATGAATDVPLPNNAYGKALALGSDGGYAYTLLGNTTSPDSELARVDLATRQMDPVRLQVPLSPGAMPLFYGLISEEFAGFVNLNESGRSISESHDGELLAVASYAHDYSDSCITLVDKDGWSVISSISFGSSDPAYPPDAFLPIGMKFSLDNSRLYVITKYAVFVVAVDGASSKVLQQRYTESPPFQWTTDLVLTPDGSKLYVGQFATFDFGDGYHVWVLDPDTLETIATVVLPLHDDLGLPPYALLALNSPMYLRWSEDGSKLYAFSLNDEVHAIDPVTDQVIGTAATGFRSPTSPVPLTDDSRGAGDHFLMASFSSANDGIAVLTIEEPVVDVIFESGFEQD